MKQVKILWLVAALFCATTAFGKDIKTVVFRTTPEMHCNNCETKIKNNLRFEKGVKEIVTDLGDKTVTVKYDADKTTVEALIKGFAKIKYSAVPVTEKKEGEKSTCPEKTTCPEEMEECMDDVFLDVWEHIERFDAAKGRNTGSFSSVARSTALAIFSPTT